MEDISDLDLSCFREVQKLSLIRAGFKSKWERKVWRQQRFVINEKQRNQAVATREVRLRENREPPASVVMAEDSQCFCLRVVTVSERRVGSWPWLGMDKVDRARHQCVGAST